MAVRGCGDGMSAVFNGEETAFLEASFSNPGAPAPTWIPPCFLTSPESRGKGRGARHRADREQGRLTLPRGQPGPPRAPWGRKLVPEQKPRPLAVVPAGWGQASGTICLPSPPSSAMHLLGSEPAGCLRNQIPTLFLFTEDTQKPPIWTVKRTTRSCFHSGPREHFWGS